jgi:uncharacterized membrane protein YsdA (DUF1294 family)/cold shock CspA family protein
MAKKLSGNLVEWDDERGFGFLQSGAVRVFVHRREFSERRKEIEEGDRLRFLMGQDEKGRPCAKFVEHATNGGSFSLAAFSVWLGLLILPGLALEGLFASWLWVGGYLLGINGLTVLFYWLDKWKARQGKWRVSEMNLHLLELVGGWPAAFLLQRLLRHKIAKLSYQVVFWIIVVSYQLAAFEFLSGGQIVRGSWAYLVRVIER